jgi:hypothetical protein
MPEMQWTPRMEEMQALIAAGCGVRGGGKPPNRNILARHMGLSAGRTGQIWMKLERWNQTHRLPQHVRDNRLKARYLLNTLGRIEKAARAAARQHQLQPHIDRIKFRYRVDDDRAWTIYRLERLHLRQLADEKKQAERTWAAAYYFLRSPRTQEDLQRLARGAHWADVVYEAGTDRIVRVRRVRRVRRWR